MKSLKKIVSQLEADGSLFLIVFQSGLLQWCLFPTAMNDDLFPKPEDFFSDDLDACLQGSLDQPIGDVFDDLTEDDTGEWLSKIVCKPDVDSIVLLSDSLKSIIDAMVFRGPKAVSADDCRDTSVVFKFDEMFTQFNEERSQRVRVTCMPNASKPPICNSPGNLQAMP